MGLRVVVSDVDPQAPGFAVADDRIIASTYDEHTTAAEAERYHRCVRPIAGVMCIASDVPLTVATVAAALHLPGIRIESARLASDKLLMKEKFSADGVPVPRFWPLDSSDRLHELVGQWGLPLVLKPVDSRGARGVLRLTPGIDLDRAYDYSRRQSPTGRLMVEQFLTGPQVSTESIVLDGVAHTPGFADRNYEYLERFSPHIIENGGALPVSLDGDVQGVMCQVVQCAVRSMGITEGVVKGDIVVHDGAPYVIELAARLSGGYFCSHEIPLNTGVDFVAHAIGLAVGNRPQPADLTPRFQRPVAQRYLFPRPGRVVGVSGMSEVEKRPGIALCEVRVKVGDVVTPVDRHPARAGVVITTGDTRQQAVERAVAAVNDIHIETVPSV